MKPKKFKVTYKAIIKAKQIEIVAFSKYDAKQRFYAMYPRCTIISVEEVKE